MKRVHLELSRTLKAQGYTMRANINASSIKALKAWNKDTAAVINTAIKQGDCRMVINEMQLAASRNHTIRELTTAHDKLIYNAAGETVAIWDDAEQKVYDILHEKAATL